MKIALIGAGLIGQSIAHLLRETGDYDVVAFDRDAHALALLEEQGIPTRRVDSADANALRLALGTPTLAKLADALDRVRQVVLSVEF